MLYKRIEFETDEIPTEKDILTIINMLKQVPDHIIILYWFIPYNGWNYIRITKDDTLESCLAKIPKIYGV